MRVVHINTADKGGGAEGSAFNLVRALRQHDYDAQLRRNQVFRRTLGSGTSQAGSPDRNPVEIDCRRDQRLGSQRHSGHETDYTIFGTARFPDSLQAMDPGKRRNRFPCLPSNRQAYPRQDRYFPLPQFARLVLRPQCLGHAFKSRPGHPQSP